MKRFSKSALALMALVLVAATAATAATALAGSKQHCRQTSAAVENAERRIHCESVGLSVARTVTATSQAILRAKIKRRPAYRVTVGVPRPSVSVD